MCHSFSRELQEPGFTGLAIAALTDISEAREKVKASSEIIAEEGKARGGTG